MLTSASGVYDDKAKDVNLEGQVVISEATTFTARMEKAYVQIETKAIEVGRAGHGRHGGGRHYRRQRHANNR